MPVERLLHEGDLLRCFRNSVSVPYVSTLPSTSSSAPCISSFVQSLCTFETNVREWHFVQHSHGASTLRVPHGSSDLSDLSDSSDKRSPQRGTSFLAIASPLSDRASQRLRIAILRPLHNTPSAASLSRFGLGHVRKHTPFALTLSSLHLWYSAKSLPKKRCFFGERPFCKGLP